MNDLEHLDSTEIGDRIDKKDVELSEVLKNHHVVEQEKLNLQKTILELQSKKKDLEIALSKSTHCIRQINIELKLLRSKFWQAKHTGL